MCFKFKFFAFIFAMLSRNPANLNPDLISEWKSQINRKIRKQLLISSINNVINSFIFRNSIHKQKLNKCVFVFMSKPRAVLSVAFSLASTLFHHSSFLCRFFQSTFQFNMVQSKLLCSFFHAGNFAQPLFCSSSLSPSTPSSSSLLFSISLFRVVDFVKQFLCFIRRESEHLF